MLMSNIIQFSDYQKKPEEEEECNEETVAFELEEYRLWAHNLKEHEEWNNIINSRVKLEGAENIKQIMLEARVDYLEDEINKLKSLL